MFAGGARTSFEWAPTEQCLLLTLPQRRFRLSWYKLALLASTSSLALGAHDAAAATAASASASTVLDTPVAIDLTSDITFTYTPVVTVSSGPGHGSTSIAGEVVTYTPAPGFVGIDSFTYTVTGDPPTASALVTVTITGTSPSSDPSVYGVVGSLRQTALFSALTQITNFNRHLDNLRDLLRSLKSSGVAGNEQWAPKDSLRLASLVAIAVPKDTKVARNSTSRATPAQTAEANGDPGAPIELPDRIGIFMNGSLSLGQISGSGIRPDASPRTSSVSAGIDYRLNSSAIVGIGGGYTNNITDIGGGSKSTSNGYNVTVYGTMRPIDQIYIDGQASYGRINFHATRNVSSVTFAFANPDAAQVWGSLTGGYEFEYDAYTFGPYLRFDGSHSSIDAFSETGASTSSLSYGKQNVDSVLSVLGFRGDRAFSTEYGIVSPHLRAEYQHEFIGTSGTNVGFANGAASGFRINGYPMSRNYFTVGGGVSFLTIDAISAFIDYDALLGYTHQTNYSITVGASARF